MLVKYLLLSIIIALGEARAADYNCVYKYRCQIFQGPNCVRFYKTEIICDVNDIRDSGEDLVERPARISNAVESIGEKENAVETLGINPFFMLRGNSKPCREGFQRDVTNLCRRVENWP